MTILVVTAYPPVLHMHGGGVRMYHNIRLLAQHHTVHVISFVENDGEVEMLRTVADICHSVRAIRRIPDFRPHWLSLKPFLVREFSTPEMHDAVDQTLRERKIDVLQCEYLQMAQFRRRGALTVLTAHEILSANAYEAFVKESDPREKLRLFYRWMQMLLYEVRQVRKFDRVVTMTAEDAAYLKSYAPSADIRPIPIGIDPQEFSPIAAPNQPVTALFVGNFRHSPNLEALRFIVEHVAPRFPDVRFLIPGSHVPNDIRAGSNVSFPGYCADTRQLYRYPNTIVLAPLFSGTGQRVKLLEAFSMACPVITSTIGALGYPVRNGTEAMVADTVGEFVSALQSLVQSRELREQIGENGRRMIVARFTWERIGEELNSVTLTDFSPVIRGTDTEFAPKSSKLQLLRSEFGLCPRITSTSPNSGEKSVNVTEFRPPSPLLKKLVFPIKAVTFVWRFFLLLLCTAYLEGSRVRRD
jgi:glycosyltransferase involved in cell wall biosynthesis